VSETLRCEDLLDAAIAALLGRLSRDWQTIDTDHVVDLDRQALTLCTWANFVECRFNAWAWNSASRMQFQCFVTGCWSDVLPDHIRAVVPSWAGSRVWVQLEPILDARLTSDGLIAQADLLHAGMERLIVLLAAKSQPQPPRISVRIQCEASAAPGGVPGPLAAAQATASIGNIVVQNQIVLDPAALAVVLAQAAQVAPPPPPEPAKPADKAPGSSPEAPQPVREFTGNAERDRYDERYAWLAGRWIYLGSDTQLGRLFWVLAEPFGRRRSLREVQLAVDGHETSQVVGSTPAQVEQAAKRLRKVLSKLRLRLQESRLDETVMINTNGSGERLTYCLQYCDAKP
jgi:hypothetical protein